MAKPNIRLAVATDLPAIERLCDVVQGLHAEVRPDVFRIPVDNDSRRAFLDRAISDDLWRLWVAETEGKTVAYLMTEVLHKEGPIRPPHTEGHLHQICVAPEFRRNGIGMALIQSAIAELETQKTDRITVAYWTFNSASMALFEAVGFAPFLITSEFVRT